MATRLWNYFDGEPFMENPRLGILTLGNKPRKRGKKGRKNMAKRRQPAALRRYWATHRKKGRKAAAPRKRRRSRKNWMQSGTMLPVNPPRKHHRKRHYRTNAHHRRKHRRNPAFLGLHVPAIRPIAFGVLGFASPPLVQGFLTSMAPSVMQTAMSAGMLGKYAVKVTSVALASWLTHRFIGASDGNAVMIGGGINIGMSLVNDFAPGFLPANPLSAYIPVRPGLRAYIPVRPGLRAVPQVQGSTVAGGHMRRMPMPSGTAANVGSNAMWGPALRYQRY